MNTLENAISNDTDGDTFSSEYQICYQGLNLRHDFQQGFDSSF